MHKVKSDKSIILDEIEFSYGAKRVLKEISASIPTGQIWALVGRSGTGKTTLLHILAGLFRPTAGSLKVGGRSSPKPGMIRGVVFQENSLLGWLSVEENVLFPRHRKPPEELKCKAHGILDSIGLAHARELLPSQLSTGMRKRVEFARALIADRDYLLADEPFGSVDALTRRELWKVWLNLRATEPRTGVLTTHDPSEAVRLCDTVIVLDDCEPSKVAAIFDCPENVKHLETFDTNSDLVETEERILSALGTN